MKSPPRPATTSDHSGGSEQPCLGMVRQWQNLFYGKRYSHTILNDQVDFVKLAEAMGAKAYRVTRQEDLKPVLEEAIALHGAGTH